MNHSLLRLLVDPRDGSPLRLAEGAKLDGGQVSEGLLLGGEGRAYALSQGIPRLVCTEDEGQLQTSDGFGFKWQQRETYETPQSRDFGTRWLAERYGFADAEQMHAYFRGRELVLDAGCGAGSSAERIFGGDFGRAQWFGVDISQAVDVAQERLGQSPQLHYIQGDVLNLPFPDATFDTVFSEGVLHHTPSTRAGVLSVARTLRPGGEALFYVYRKKSPAREFCDDHIRAAVAELPPAQAWEALRPLTALAKSLSDLKTSVEVPQDVELLGIPAGRHDVQRLIYWHFAKLFWNDSFTFEENNHVNFDWYYPRYSHRQTEQEVRGWCAEAGLDIHRLHVSESGFSVRAIKREA